MNLELLGFLACAIVGILLGLLGAGGSILTVPVLVYFFGLPPLLATSYSLFIVGSTSMVASINKYQRGEVLIKPALLFAFISITAVISIRSCILPHIIYDTFRIGHIEIAYDNLCMLLFAVLMIVAALFMVTQLNDKQFANDEIRGKRWLKVSFFALAIGAVTGLLGAGGGFLIFPVLTLLLHVEVKKAVGTSLTIVALNSFSGFASDMKLPEFNWFFLLTITAIALVGGISGMIIAQKIDSRMIKKCFAWLVLSMGLVILLTEFSKLTALSYK